MARRPTGEKSRLLEVRFSPTLRNRCYKRTRESLHNTVLLPFNKYAEPGTYIVNPILWSEPLNSADKEFGWC